VLPHLAINIALLATTGLLIGSGLALAASYLRNHRSSQPASTLTPWQRRTWSTPTLELVKPVHPARPRLLALAILRGYILTIAGLLLLKLIGVIPA
jgi:hypothetical protein